MACTNLRASHRVGIFCQPCATNCSTAAPQYTSSSTGPHPRFKSWQHKSYAFGVFKSLLWVLPNLLPYLPRLRLLQQPRSSRWSQTHTSIHEASCEHGFQSFTASTAQETDKACVWSCRSRFFSHNVASKNTLWIVRHLIGTLQCQLTSTSTEQRTWRGISVWKEICRCHWESSIEEKGPKTALQTSICVVAFERLWNSVVLF